MLFFFFFFFFFFLIVILQVFGNPFSFLFVVFGLWCRCFKCVLLSLCVLERKGLGNCIDF